VAGLKDLAGQLLSVEEPLLAAYKDLRAAANGRVALALCTSVCDAQAAQLAHLRFLQQDLPAEFVAVGSITSNNVKLRKGAGGSHPMVCELQAGLPVIVMSWSGYWAAVQIPGGQQGFVFRDYVRVDDAGASGAGHSPQ